MSKKLLALGDCNTLGIKNCHNNTYVEKFSSLMNLIPLNFGYTMSTTNEGVIFFDNNFDENCEYISIQYGLVDSWVTFKYSPYVLYYPDNLFRKIARKFVKKYKKICKILGLNTILGIKNVVSIENYERNIEKIIKSSMGKHILLIETVPNKDFSRNNRIKKYNKILKRLSDKYNNCLYIEIYDYFFENIDELYIDDTHINEYGHEYIAKKIFESLK